MVYRRLEKLFAQLKAMLLETGIPLEIYQGIVQNFMELDYEGINFQTGMSLKDVIAFYRQAFSAQGLKERDLLTIINDEVFSMVFDGAPNGKAVVIQGVLLGSGSVNINIRYEDT